MALSMLGGMPVSPARSISAFSMLMRRDRGRSTGPTGRAGSSPRRSGAGRPAGRARPGRAADRAVAGDDHVGEIGDHLEHVGPLLGVALERERRHAEEAEVAGEQQVGVGDERHHVARGVTRRGQQLDARRELRGVVDDVRHGPRPDLAEVVELVGERGRRTSCTPRRASSWSSSSLVAGEPSTIALRNALRPADVIDVRVREQHALHRLTELGDRVDERLPLRTHHQRVDHGEPVVVDDDPRVRDPRTTARLDPRVDPVAELLAASVMRARRPARGIEVLVDPRDQAASPSTWMMRHAGIENVAPECAVPWRTCCCSTPPSISMRRTISYRRSVVAPTSHSSTPSDESTSALPVVEAGPHDHVGGVHRAHRCEVAGLDRGDQSGDEIEWVRSGGHALILAGWEHLSDLS